METRNKRERKPNYEKTRIYVARFILGVSLYPKGKAAKQWLSLIEEENKCSRELSKKNFC